MHGDFFLLENGDRSTSKAIRLPLGETRGRNEAWLRDILFANPDLLPIPDIEPAYGPLLPLCTELRTPAGPLDIAYINPAGRLTLVECKLWRNAEARRKVVAQVLDYARTIKSWSYSDLQRQVSIATKRQGNVPFEIAQAAAPQLQEHHFIDSVSRSMREGRFLLLVAGDGIREDVGGIADLINRNATSGFSFGQVEVALYEFPDGALAIQPRAITRTHLIERHIVIASGLGAASLSDAEQSAEEGSPEVEAGISGSGSAIRDAETAWWEPVTKMRFDDPEQDPPKYRWRNHVRADLPEPGLWLAAYLPHGGAGVFLSGNRDVRLEANRALIADQTLMAELPDGAKFATDSNGDPYLDAIAPAQAFANDDAKREWICAVLNQFANTLRPRLKRLRGE
jgi:hypothetical protein